MSQRYPEASKIEEGTIGGEQMLMAHQQSAELAKPGVGSFDDPTPLVAPQFGHPQTFFACDSPGKARSARCRVSAIAGARGPNRRQCRRSPVPVFAADGPSLVARGLRRAWLPQA